MKPRHIPITPKILACAIGLCLGSTNALADGFKFSGFIQTAGGMVDDEKGQKYLGYSEDKFTFNRNIIGLQATSKVADKLSATVQLISRGEKDYQTRAEWAYITYQATSTSRIRAGRLRTPFYMYSDFLEVGYAYWWINPPREVYYQPFNNIDGIDFYKTGNLGIFDTSIQVYAGTLNDAYDLAGTGVLSNSKTRNQMGLAATLGQDWWTLRAAYHQADLSLDMRNIPVDPKDPTKNLGNSLLPALKAYGFTNNLNNVLIEDDKAKFNEIGFNFDTGTFLGAAETVLFEPEGSVLAKHFRYYLMLGYRYNDLVFHATQQKSDDSPRHPEQGIPADTALPGGMNTDTLIGGIQKLAAKAPIAIQRDVTTLGIRWDVTHKTALKLQVDSVDDQELGKQKVYAIAAQAVF